MFDLPYKTILFDNDDTLIRSVDYGIPGWREAAIAAGLVDRDASIWRERWGGLAVDLVRRVYNNNITEEKAKEVLRIRQEMSAKDNGVIPPVQGATDIVSLLAKEHTLGIVTSRERAPTDNPSKYPRRNGNPVMSLLDYRLDSAGFDPRWFAITVTCDENQYHKPDHKVFEKPAVLLKERGLSIDDAAYIGDDVTDFLAARGAGLQYLAVLTGVKTKKDFVERGCSSLVIMDSIADLPIFIQQYKTRVEGVLPALTERLRDAWSAETSSEPDWTPENPAWGQCAVTACIVQDFLGGQLLRTLAGYKGENKSHYFNRLPDGRVIDLTREQFVGGAEFPTPGVRARSYVLNKEKFPEPVARYKRLCENAGLPAHL